MSTRAVRLAIVDDSSFMRKALVRVLEGESRVTVVGTAATGEELLANLDRWSPDVITLDLSMPGLGGMGTLDRLMSSRPVPVVILSTHSAKDAPLTIEALHRGAIDFIDKQQVSLVDFERLRALLVEKVLGAVRDERTRDRHDREPAPAADIPSRPPSPGIAIQGGAAGSPGAAQVVVIGASTGGPPAIQRVLEGLGGGIGVPVAVVQHMPAGFTRPFAERLDAHLPLTVVEASNGEPLLGQFVYVAPAGQHLRVRRGTTGLTCSLSTDPDDVPHCPSVDVLFESAARACGGRVLAALLTGMGDDGARGMGMLLAAGAHTIAQDPTSCVVYGMPGAAVRRGAVREQLDLEAIGPRLKELLRSGPSEV